MAHLGKCTANVFWRLEEHNVVKWLLRGWNLNPSSRTATDNPDDGSLIIKGSPGIGKSTLLCVMAFHLVFRHKKHVLVYRKLGTKKNALFFLGHEELGPNDGEGKKAMTCDLNHCTDGDAKMIYDFFKQRHGSSVWLLLDGFEKQSIPDGMGSFRLLSTSQQVDIKEQETEYMTRCLLSAWRKKDLFKLGREAYGLSLEEMEKRYYYTGGNVRLFVRGNILMVSSQIREWLGLPDDPSTLRSDRAYILTGDHQVDRLRRTFIVDGAQDDSLIMSGQWEQIIDSEYAVLALSTYLRSAELYRIYTWARCSGHGSLAGITFELYIPRLACESSLKLFVTKCDPPSKRKSREKRHLKVFQLRIKQGNGLQSGTTEDYWDDSEEWRDKSEYSYWYPACHEFPNIDGILKVESGPGMSGIAYLQVTVALKHDIDAKQLEKMNEMFPPLSSGNADDADVGINALEFVREVEYTYGPLKDGEMDEGDEKNGDEQVVENEDDPKKPLYIAVCPDLISCKALILKPSREVLEARKNCRVYVGYYDEASRARSSDGPNNHIPPKKLLPPPHYNLRTRNQPPASAGVGKRSVEKKSDKPNSPAKKQNLGRE